MKAASAAFAAAISRSHRIATRLEVLTNGVEVATIDTTLEGNVTLDGTAQIRGRAALRVTDDGTLDLIPTGSGSHLAPYGNEIRVSRGITHPDDTMELVSLGVFRIDDVTTTDNGSNVDIAINGLDRSARIIDARFEEPYTVTAGTNYTTAILSVLQDAWLEIPHDFTATTRTTPQLIAEEGADRWAFATEMATSIGMVLFFDGTGTCVLRPVAVNGSPVATLAEGQNGVLLTASRRWTREGTFNRVIATGENTGEGAPVRGVATDENPLSPTYYFGPFGKIPRFYVSQFITTSDQAEDAAEAILAKEIGTSRQVNFGSLVDPRLEPDDVVRITRELSGIDEDHVIDQIVVPLAAEQSLSGRTRATRVTT